MSWDTVLCRATPVLNWCVCSKGRDGSVRLVSREDELRH